MGNTTAERDDPVEHNQGANDACGEADPKTGDQGITHKFIRKDEIAPDIDSQLINWSVKETVYKYFSEQSLQYFDMKLMPFEEFENTKRVFNLKMNSYLDVYYELNDKYVLTYTYHKG